MSIETTTFIYYGTIALLVAVIVGCGFAGWKALLAGIFWPIIGIVITLGIFTSWLFHDQGSRY